jgi:hypothetical protein
MGEPIGPETGCKDGKPTTEALVLHGRAYDLCGAGRHERSEERVNRRNGHLDRTFETRFGTMRCASRRCDAPGRLLPDLHRAAQDDRARPRHRHSGKLKGHHGTDAPAIRAVFSPVVTFSADDRPAIQISTRRSFICSVEVASR